MTTYTFNGRVLPERADFSIIIRDQDNALVPIQIEVSVVDAGFTIEGTLTIFNSQVSLTARVIDGNPDIEALRNYVELYVRSLVDAYGYIKGYGYDLEITSVTTSNGLHRVFGVGVEELEEKENERPISFFDLAKLMEKSPHLRRALADLRQAIRSHSDSHFHCYRAVESLRQHFENKSWEELNSALRLERSWHDAYKNLSDEQRHGGLPYTTRRDRILAMEHAWKTVDRFIEFVKREFVDLPADEFELLK